MTAPVGLDAVVQLIQTAILILIVAQNAGLRARMAALEEKLNK
jgi:hypothetical protein